MTLACRNLFQDKTRLGLSVTDDGADKVRKLNDAIKRLVRR